MLAIALMFAVAILAGAGLTPLVIRMAGVWGLYDAPHGDRRVHTEPVPRLGGVAVFLAMGVALLTLALAPVVGLELLPGASNSFFGILFGAGIIFAIGLVDDVRGLRPIAKLAAQFVAASVVYASGFGIDVLSLGPSTEFAFGVFSLPVTLFWIVGVTNAFNLIDGLDGLATGVALVALSTTLVVAMVLGNAEVVFLCVALIGALLGFMRYNFNPARIFLGDSGSLFIGFMLAVLSVYGSQQSGVSILHPGTSVLAIVPLCALAVPLLDTVLAILRRWLRGVPLSQADGRHIHHRLLALGLAHRHAVIVLYVAASVLAVLGLCLVFAPPPAIVSVAAAAGGMTIFLLVYGLRRLQYHEFAEAGSVLASGLIRVRRTIRDQIYAQDVAQILRHAQSFEQVSAILEDNASTFNFLHMEVCRDTDAGSRPLVLFNGHAARAWKLDYPVTPHDFAGGEDYVLRIWCNPQSGSRPYGAERVARVLAPVLESWILEAQPKRAERRIRSQAMGTHPPLALAEETTHPRGTDRPPLPLPRA